MKLWCFRIELDVPNGQSAQDGISESTADRKEESYGASLLRRVLA